MEEEQIEVADTSVETEVEQTVEDVVPTLEDYNRLQKEVQTLKAQKEHFKKKATQTKETNQTNTQSGLTREEAILFAKGLTEEEVELANRIAKVNNVNLIKATEDEYFQSKIEKRRQEEISRKAQLSPSGGSGFSKDTSQMSDEEHRDYAQKMLAGL